MYSLVIMSSNPFKSSSNIQIRLTRNENEAQDDRIVICYKDDNYYQVFFQDGNMKAKQPVTYCTVLSGEQMDAYVESLFTLVARDRDPFRSIEFQIPCFPTLQYDVADMRKGKIRNTLKQIMPILQSAAKW